MSGGEALTRGAIFVALALAVLGSTGDRAAVTPRTRQWTRWAWTSACLAYLLHVGSAFHHYYEWSHAVAYRETARQTAAVFGLEWGGGVYFNYFFTAAWVADVAWRWWKRESPELPPRALVNAWRSFFLFIVFNATVVFGTAPARWLGAAVCLSLATLWWLPIRRSAQ